MIQGLVAYRERYAASGSLIAAEQRIDVSLTAVSEVSRDNDEISLAVWFQILNRRKLLITAVSLVFALVAAAVAFLLPSTYKAEAVIMPPQQTQSSMSMMSAQAAQLGGLANVGLAGMFWKNPSDLYIGILQSRTIADALIDEFHLQRVYGLKKRSDVGKRLAKLSSFTSKKDQLIHIVVQDHDQKRSADLANAYVSHLFEQNQRLALTEASQRRLFFEQQIAQERNALTAAEVAFKNTQQTTGLIVPGGQAEGLVRSGMLLRAEIANREVQLQAVRSYATEENSEVRVLQTEINTLNGQLRRLKNQTGNQSPDGIEIPAGKLPEVGLEYGRKLRDFKYHEAVYEVLQKQYEIARIDEAKLAPVIQVVDRAVHPDRKSGPPRTVIVVVTALVTGLVVWFWLIFQHYAATARLSGKYQ
ncbi:MAG: Wzz/FepE/Etk N-terminal domain-containing protein [Bryobacteraceae bacterium]